MTRYKFEQALIPLGIKAQLDCDVAGFSKTSLLEAPSVVKGVVDFATRVEVGAFTGIYGCRVRHTTVGRYCSIAEGVHSGWDEHPLDRVTTSLCSFLPDLHGWASDLGKDARNFTARAKPFLTIPGATQIGHDVWIGQGAFLRTGVRIGTGAVIGARSVVIEDVAPYTIVAGTPARIVRSRFSDEIIDKLIASRWWEYCIYDFDPALLIHPSEFCSWFSDHVEVMTPYSGAKFSKNDFDLLSMT